MKSKNKAWYPLFMEANETQSTLTIEGDIVVLTATGKHDIAFAKQIFADILQACLQEKKSRIIIDISALRGEVSNMEKFDYLTHVSALLKNYIFSGGTPPRIAHLLDPEYLQQGKGYTDVLAKQLNLNMKGFDSKDDALNWLLP